MRLEEPANHLHITQIFVPKAYVEKLADPIKLLDICSPIHHMRHPL